MELVLADEAIVANVQSSETTEESSKARFLGLNNFNGMISILGGEDGFNMDAIPFALFHVHLGFSHFLSLDKTVADNNWARRVVNNLTLEQHLCSINNYESHNIHQPHPSNVGTGNFVRKRSNQTTNHCRSKNRRNQILRGG